MRLIDADALTEDILKSFAKSDRARDMVKHIQFAPTIDAVPVVRCKDCKSFKEYTPEFKQSAECVEGADGDCITRVLYSDAHPQFSAVRKCDYCSLGAKMGGAEV